MRAAIQALVHASFLRFCLFCGKKSHPAVAGVPDQVFLRDLPTSGTDLEKVASIPFFGCPIFFILIFGNRSVGFYEEIPVEKFVPFGLIVFGCLKIPVSLSTVPVK